MVTIEKLSNGRIKVLDQRYSGSKTYYLNPDISLEIIKGNLYFFENGIEKCFFLYNDIFVFIPLIGEPAYSGSSINDVADYMFEVMLEPVVTGGSSLLYEYEDINTTGNITFGTNVINKVITCSGNIELTLPSIATSEGRYLHIKNLGELVKIICQPGEYIDDYSEILLTLYLESNTLYCTSTKWIII
jgi:hypothetical protein